jgi:hypothetical protein
MATTPKSETRQIAQFVGFHGTRRIITKADQDRLVGVPSGVGKEDLVWEPGNSKLDVTDVHPDVLEYLQHDEEFKVKSVEVTPDAAS